MTRLPIVWDRELQRWCVMRRGAVVKSFPTLLAAEEWVLAQSKGDAS